MSSEIITISNHKKNAKYQSIHFNGLKRMRKLAAREK